jgi:hypothetical protein
VSEDENGTSFRNVVRFSELQTMNKIQNLSKPDFKRFMRK